MKKTLLIGLITISSILSANSIAKCTGCHGKNFEKAALGKSKIVKDMGEEDLIVALNGYRNGSYGGPMKGLMKAQLKGLDTKILTTEILSLHTTSN